MEDRYTRRKFGDRRRDTHDTGGVGMVGGERWKIDWNINNGYSDSAISQETKLT
jgi:hypothetical protein